jgi:hypothetical protein
MSAPLGHAITPDSGSTTTWTSPTPKRSPLSPASSNGNFRLVQRLFAQIERILEINHLRTITAEVVQAAREPLVIGLP